MGLLICLETEPETPPCPDPMNVWDDRFLIEFLSWMNDEQWVGPNGEITTLDRAAGVDLAPLGKIAGQDFGIEDYVDLVGEDDAEQVWREQTVKNEAAWQDPQEIAGCLRTLIRAWIANPQIWFAVTSARTRDYYAQGIAQRDLTGLLRHVEWAAAHGARRVRLLVF